MVEKTKLRNRLFEKYFELSEGVVLADLMKKISFVTKKYQILHKMFEQNLDDYDLFSSNKMIKIVEYNGNNYLIVKVESLWSYLIVDLKTNQVLTFEDVQSKFNEEFFIDNFSEMKVIDGINYLDMYYFLTYKGNIQTLVDFCIENQKIFSMKSNIYYRLNIDNAWTYIYINLVNGEVQLGFETLDQFLYEQLFLKSDLTPCEMQDAQSKIGVEKMKEMFERIPDIKIPVACIPIEIFQKSFIDYKNCELHISDQLKLIKKK